MYGRSVAQRVQTRGTPAVVPATNVGGHQQSFKRMIDVVFSYFCSVSIRKEG